MHSECTAAAICEYLEVSSRLCSFYDSERVLLPGHWYVDCVVARDLKKDSTVRPTLVSLPGRVQEPRPKLRTRRHSLSVSDRMADALQLRFVFFVHLYITQHGEIISSLYSCKVRAQKSSQGIRLAKSTCILRTSKELDSTLVEHRFLGRQCSSLFVLLGELAGFNFACLDIRLIEGVNPDN